MADVLIYTKSWCGFCYRAKSLLELNGVGYEEIDVEAEPALEIEMIRRAGGGVTVPQVFIRGEHVGGSDELANLAMRGGLEGLAPPAAEDGEES